MSLISGLHHVSMKCSDDAQFAEVIRFYRDVLGLTVARQWDSGILFQTGGGLIEVFHQGDAPLPKGTVRHFAFAAKDVDACAKAVESAGYEVFLQPKDIVIPSEPAYPARIAFCYGPLGEEIEFFCEK